MPRKLKTFIKRCDYHDRDCEFSQLSATYCRERRRQYQNKARYKPADLETMVCTKCGEEKTVDNFHLNNAMPEGRTKRCKSCMKQEQNARLGNWDANVRKKVTASWKAHDNADRVNKLDLGVAMQMFRDQDYKCNHCSRPLETHMGTKQTQNPWGASLDRIDCNIVGYGGNAQWLCMSCNNGKNTMADHDHKEKFATRDRRIATLLEQIEELKCMIEPCTLDESAMRDLEDLVI